MENKTNNQSIDELYSQELVKELMLWIQCAVILQRIHMGDQATMSN